MGNNRGRYRSEDFDPTRQPRDTTAQCALLERALTRVGSPAELARRLLVTPSHVCRLRKGTAGVSIVLALRFADVLDEDGIALLRTVGHANAAEHIDRLRQGSPQRPRTVLDAALDRLSATDRRLIVSFVDRLLVNTTGPTPLPAPDPQTRSRR